MHTTNGILAALQYMIWFSRDEHNTLSWSFFEKTPADFIATIRNHSTTAEYLKSKQFDLGRDFFHDKSLDLRLIQTYRPRKKKSRIGLLHTYEPSAMDFWFCGRYRSFSPTSMDFSFAEKVVKSEKTVTETEVKLPPWSHRLKRFRGPSIFKFANFQILKIHDLVETNQDLFYLNFILFPLDIPSLEPDDLPAVYAEYNAAADMKQDANVWITATTLFGEHNFLNLFMHHGWKRVTRASLFLV